jgi:tRNA modification GTPase
MPYLLDDTIAAISTPPGEGGLCVVRVTGNGTFAVADRVFRGKVRPSACPTHTVHYGHIIDPASQEIIDEVLLTILRAPKTYTCEDTVEISGHGGCQPGTRILNLLLTQGARLAEPGEFTKRAFLNGRIDLVQAEAVAELIRARTDACARAAMRQLDGRFSQSIQTLRDRILQALAFVEVGLDFVEEDIEEFSDEYLFSLLSAIASDLDRIRSDSERSKLLRDGVRIAIVGRPNVGKSSIFNVLIDINRAIVDPTPGTTRDTIEAAIDLDGVPATVIDTAGLHPPADALEAQGIQRTQREIDAADFFLWVVDGSVGLTAEDPAIHARLLSERTLLLVNKCDLPPALAPDWHLPFAPIPTLPVSALTGEGVSDIKRALYRLITGTPARLESDVLLNTRHQEKLHHAGRHLERSIQAIPHKTGHEIVAIELRSALHALGEMIGKDLGDDLLDRIFSTFCIGK